VGALNGEVIHVHNGSISSVRVLPRGVKELAVELFVNDREEGERLVADVAEILPEGPTTFILRPWIERMDELDRDLTRIRLLTTVAPGREWLAEDFFADLLRQRADDSLVVHGPVTLAADEHAASSYARASAATRTNLPPRRPARAHQRSPSGALAKPHCLATARAVEEPRPAPVTRPTDHPAVAAEPEAARERA
jgi:hypothetical protein